MTRLMISEWRRIWNKKFTWIVLLLIPVIVGISVPYYLQKNENFDPLSAEFTSFANFPIMSVSEQLITIFNLVVIWLVVSMVTEEYHSGQLRLVLLRAYHFNQIFTAKFLTALAVIAVYLITFFIFSYGFGFIFFPHVESVSLFHYVDPVSMMGALFYNIAYYVLVWLSLVAVICVMLLFAVACRSPIIAIGNGTGFLIFSLMFPNIVEEVSWSSMLQFASITQIQWQGIVLMLHELPALLTYGGILIGYIVIFYVLSRLAFVKMDQFT